VRNQYGFTLIELLVSIAIIGVVTAIVVVRSTAFDSTVIVKSAAYDIALSIREAQARSVSSMRMDSMQSLDFPYGLSFSANTVSAGNPDKKTYLLFQHPYATTTMQPRYDKNWVKATTTLDKSIEVYDICYTVNGTDYICDIDRLDIAFRRPEFTSWFFTTRTSSPPPDPATIRGVKIKVKSTQGSNVFIVDVSKLGQISVSKE
jgi:prepilin-type N-terminal cleavage/methylation domain-containing protein